MTAPKHDRAAAQMADQLHDRIVKHYATRIAAALQDVKGLKGAIDAARRTHEAISGN